MTGAEHVAAIEKELGWPLPDEDREYVANRLDLLDDDKTRAAAADWFLAIHQGRKS